MSALQRHALTDGLPPSGVGTDGDPGPPATRGLGSVIGQGYLLGQPIPAHGIAGLLAPVERLPRTTSVS